ncbi:hypothetical protein [Agromyces sp. SYSU T00194]|uniref:hypothetical protein n=1 Tax=Agromyces chitinivorans TaxID=3158560 RepID=UPI00339095F8
MHTLTKAALGFAAVAALTLGATTPAQAAPPLHPDANASGTLGQSQRITIDDDIDFNVSLRAGCHNFHDAPWMQVIVVNYADEGYSWKIDVDHGGIFAGAWNINTWGLGWNEDDAAFEMVRTLEADPGAFTQGAWVELDRRRARTAPPPSRSRRSTRAARRSASRSRSRSSVRCSAAARTAPAGPPRRTGYSRTDTTRAAGRATCPPPGSLRGTARVARLAA